jgi:xylulokinase
VRSLGGASKSDLWLQMKADLLGLEVERPACPDTNSLGAAMLAAWKTGQFASLADAAQAWYRSSTIFTPNPSLYGVYEEVYQRYTYYSHLLYDSRE